MATTTDERAGSWDTRDAGDRLRVEKLRTPKGVWIMISMVAFLFVWAAITYWTASFIAPEPEESRGFAHEERDVPAQAVDDPRAID